MVKKMDYKNLSDALKGLEKLPYGTKQFTRLLQHIQEEYLRKYKNQYILCTKGKFRSGEQIFDRFSGVIEYSEYKETLYNNSAFGDDGLIYFEHRPEVEFNLDHRQLMVSTLVVNEDLDKCIALKEKNGNISLIGGHVDFNKRDYNRSLEQILFTNMLKETTEEVGGSGIIKAHTPTVPTVVVQSNHAGSTIYDSLHIFFVYLVVLSNDTFDKQIKSMYKTEKFHSPVMMSPEEALKDAKKDSVRLIMDWLIRERIIKEEKLEAKKNDSKL